MKLEENDRNSTIRLMKVKDAEALAAAGSPGHLTFPKYVHCFNLTKGLLHHSATAPFCLPARGSAGKHFPVRLSFFPFGAD